MAVKKIGTLAVAGISLALSAASFAGAGNTWTGVYAGAQLGYGWGKDDTVNEWRDGSEPIDWDGEHDIDGATGGIFAGYNYQNGNWVYGVEFDAELSNVEGGDPTWEWGDEINAEITSQFSARARLGYAFGHALIYTTAGLAFANIDTTYTNGGAVDSYDQTRSGWTLGAGVDYAFSQNWMARMEYRYADFGRVTNWTMNTDGCCDMKNDITEHAVRIGVGYKF